jgi:hypothetical protein
MRVNPFDPLRAGRRDIQLDPARCSSTSLRSQRVNATASASLAVPSWSSTVLATVISTSSSSQSWLSFLANHHATSGSLRALTRRARRARSIIERPVNPRAAKAARAAAPASSVSHHSRCMGLSTTQHLTDIGITGAASTGIGIFSTKSGAPSAKGMRRPGRL